MIVQMLLDKDADVNAADTIGRRPLHVAVEHDTRCCKILLQNRAHASSLAHGSTTPHVCASLNELVCPNAASLQRKMDIVDGNKPATHTLRRRKR